jgi:hypothetical protein
MSQPQDLAYDISVCTPSDGIAREAALLWGTQPVGLRALRRLDDGSLRSGIVDLPAGWTSAVPLVPAAIQQFALLSGRVRFGEVELGPDAFTVVPAGAILPVMVAVEDSVLVLIQDAHQAYRPVDPEGSEPAQSAPRPVIHASMFDIAPFTPVIDGQPLHGFERRVLWLDPATGADTRLLRVPGGFRSAGPSWHPVQEEIFCLSGDIQPDATRPMRAGTYLWNPAHSIHGFEEYTEGGCTLLEWHDGPWDLIRA